MAAKGGGGGGGMSGAAGGNKNGILDKVGAGRVRRRAGGGGVRRRGRPLRNSLPLDGQHGTAQWVKRWPLTSAGGKDESPVP